jgi:RNA polymerase sigma factor for flagellar operon FliA
MVRSQADVERLVRENRNLVQHQVNRYLRRQFVRGMEREDLVSWGLIGLVQAARIWDPERGASFSTLACMTIERMIIRGVRREWKSDEAAATLSLDDLLAGDKTADTQERFIERMTAEQNVEGEVLNSETCAAVRTAVARLAPAARLIIERHYYEAVPVASLAEELGVSRQGIYARQRLALRQLRAALSAAGTAAG